MTKSKEVILTIKVGKEGKVNIEAQNVNPIDAITLCNMAIKEAINQIKIEPKSTIIKPSLSESMSANSIKN